MSTVSAGMRAMDTTAKPRGTLTLPGGPRRAGAKPGRVELKPIASEVRVRRPYGFDLPQEMPAPFPKRPGLKGKQSKDFDLIRKWPVVGGDVVGVRKDEIRFLCEGKVSGQTIAASSNPTEKADLLDVPLAVVNSWWSTWQPEAKRRWHLLSAPGEPARAIVVHWKAIGKVRVEDGKTWLCFWGNLKAKRVAIDCSFDEAFGWWQSFTLAEKGTQ